MTEIDFSRRAWQSALDGMKVTKPTYKVGLLWVVLDALDRGKAQANAIPAGAELSKAFDQLLDRHHVLHRRDSFRYPIQHLSTESSPTTPDRIWEISAEVLHPLPLFRPVLANPAERAWLRERLLDWLRERDHQECVDLLSEIDQPHRPWTPLEIEFATSSYLQMLLHELRGEDGSKAQFQRNFRERFPERTEGSIEFRFANISAVLEEMGCPTVAGYKPRRHVQAALRDHLYKLIANPQFQSPLAEAGKALESLALPRGDAFSFEDVLAEPPQHSLHPPDHDRLSESPGSRILKVDFAAHEVANRVLGKEGERFVFQFERWRLNEVGRDDLAQKVQWVSRDLGDGAGFDILSFDPTSESERFLEVKTTTCGSRARFFASRNEVAFSEQNPDHFAISRVYSFRTQPRLFELHGSLQESCSLEARSYLCRPR